jgi:phenylacetate-CoA ligase
VEVTVDKTSMSRQRAMFDFFYARCGLPPGSPFFYLWGRQTEHREIGSNWRKVLASKLRGAIPIPIFSLTPAAVEEVRALIASRPDVRSAVCFTSAIDTLLAHASEEERPFRKLDRIFCGGALLTPQTRTRLHRYMAAEVYDTYGSRDLGLMAHETPGHDGLSAAAPFNHLEVLRTSGEAVADGEPGTVHVTAVNNFACALLRVDMGDTARWHAGGGETGLPGPRLTGLSGRVSEHLVGPAGVTVDPSAVIHIIGVVLAPPWVRKFQLRQRAVDEYELAVEAWEGSRDAGAEERLAGDFGRHLSKLMDSPVRVRVSVVEEIPLLPSGKHQYVVRRAAP